jgi:hypothetical protein
VLVVVPIQLTSLPVVRPRARRRLLMLRQPRPTGFGWCSALSGVPAVHRIRWSRLLAVPIGPLRRWRILLGWLCQCIRPRQLCCRLLPVTGRDLVCLLDSVLVGNLGTVLSIAWSPFEGCIIAVLMGLVPIDWLPCWGRHGLVLLRGECLAREVPLCG